MKTFYKIIRTLLVSLLVLTFITPMVLFVAVSLPSVQAQLCKTGEQELSKLLGTEVDIESINITPFNRITINNVTIKDDNNNSDALKIATLGAGIDFYELLKNGKIVISHAELIGLNAKLYKKDPSSPINIQNIINALKPKDKTKPPTKFDLRVNTVVIRQSQASFDILSAPVINERFDPNHIAVSDFSADILLPQLKNDDFIIDIKRLKASEKSGLGITDIHGYFHIASTGINVKNLEIFLNNSQLRFGDLAIDHNNWNELNDKIKTVPLDITIKSGSYISLCDLAPFIPGFKNMNERFNLDISLNGELNNLSVNRLNISHDTKPIMLNASGSLTGIKTPKTANIILTDLALTANGNDIAAILTPVNAVDNHSARKIRQLGNISLKGKFNGQPLDAIFVGDISTALGGATVNIDYSKPSDSKSLALKGNIKTGDNGIDIGKISDNTKLGSIAADLAFDVTLSPRNRKGVIDGNVRHFDFKQYRYSNITASALINNESIEGNASINDPNVNISINGDVNTGKQDPHVNIHAEIPTLNLEKLNLSKKHLHLSAIVDANFNSFDLDKADGEINISKLNFSDNPEKNLYIDHIGIEAQNTSTPQSMSISSKILNASINGSYSFKTVVPAIKDILSHSFPIFFGEHPSPTPYNNNVVESHANDFTFDITINKDENVFKYFNIGTEFFVPITINGSVNHPQNKINLVANVPYIAQKKKLIEKTSLEIDIDQSIDKCYLKAFSVIPTKHGNMPMELICNGSDNRLDASLNWVINRKETFKGDISLSTLFSRDEEKALMVDLDINPSNMVFNDSVWTIQQAKIHYANKNVIVDNFDVRHADQYISMSGKASPSPNDVLRLDLKNVNLDYIFQTLEINNVAIGGDASGTFFASQLFSKTPEAYTPLLFVKNISYNGAVFGDASIKAHWDNERQAVHLDAPIAQKDGNRSRIFGDIFPTKEALDLNFDAHKINAGFMQTYMAAFASDVQGHASGKARLFGTFKYIDLEGDIYADDLKLKINFTNAYYSASDSIKIRPGLIDIKNVTLKDHLGNTALLNGELRHKCFKEPEFEFNITEAKNFLCYDVNETPGENWFGHINGNGHASIEGKPGIVNINVEMETAPQSSFTFILSDLQSAYEYTFLSFRDKNASESTDTITLSSSEPREVTIFRENIKKKEEQADASTYNMTINVTVTPQAQMTLVMDPVGGDKIKARGSGGLKMSYNSKSEDLKMYGEYNINEGTYNFTLQDIIIKDFKIKEPSMIKFNGDPYAAQLDITAAYSLKANLSDLDESFLEDNNNTNMPVDVIFGISGIMTQPDIRYSIECNPSVSTSKSEIQSKINSIISTEDMMKRQCIYLLALNRFYTPEYMSTTKGNELFSVASSTISSQLSSMLGQLSDNWTISPHLRSDLGDFSDVEVDVALSSTLLNNRLRLNGNFGYRDKSLNTNQFIGDFDIEYLLNARGSWRLKAYNRYNDQNYYIKTATTTQGVGLMYRQEFDNFLSFLNPLKKRRGKTAVDTIPTDSVVTIPSFPITGDSISTTNSQ